MSAALNGGADRGVEAGVEAEPKTEADCGRGGRLTEATGVWADCSCRRPDRPDRESAGFCRCCKRSWVVRSELDRFGRSGAAEPGGGRPWLNSNRP